MALRKSIAIALATTALATVALGQPAQRVTGPIAVYWVSASTSSGFGGMGGGGIPNLRGVLSGGAAAGMGQAQHGLILQLGSSQKPSGEPAADHIPTASLGAGDTLPLVTPKAAPVQPSEPPEPGVPREYQRAQGRMLIFWGCGEHAPAGQPVVLDFAQMQSNPQAMAGLMKGLSVTPMRPPSPSRNAAYGEWPNERSRTAVPPTGSLVGPHQVKGNYSPDINFVLSPEKDFLAPITLTTNVKNPSGSAALGWNVVPNALGYFATVMGAGGGGGGRRGGGGDDTQIVIWSSSAVQVTSFALPDYIPPAEARRLVSERALMSPDTTSCTVPKEVVDAAPTASLQLAAYGDEANFSYPPRPANRATPWNIQWEVKVRYKSTTGGLLGVNMAEMMGGGRGGGRPGGPPQGQPQPPQPGAPQPKGQRPSAGDILRGLGLPSIPGR